MCTKTKLEDVLFCALVFGSSFIAVSAAASQEAYRIEPVLVTATRTEEPARELGVSTTVITADEIDRRQATDVLDLLRDVAGFSVSQGGSRGGSTALYARGGEDNYTMVLIDGVHVNEAGGSYDFSSITTDNIERIEIIRGPQSALYGSDAIGGVIHIITKKGMGKPTVSISTAHGAHSENGNYMGEQGFCVSGGNESMGVSLAYGRVDDQGILALNSGFSNNTVSARADLRPNAGLLLSFTGRLNLAEFNFPTENGGDRVDEVFPGLDPDQDTKTNDASVSGQVRFDLYPWWEHVLHVGFHRLDRGFDDPPNPMATALDALPGSRTDSLETRVTVDYHTHVCINRGSEVESTLTLGYEFDREDLKLDSLATIVFGDPGLGHSFSSTTTVDQARHNHAYYLQEQISLFSLFHIVGGFRVEDNSEFGTDVNPRGSIACDLRETGTKVYGNIGTGIKEPTFLENFGGFGTVGNPDLSPEKSFSWEAGVDQHFREGRILLGLTYFENRFDNMIAFIFLPATATSTFENIQRAESRGVEVTARFASGFGLTFGGNYTFLETEVTEDGGIGNLFFAKGMELLRRPKHSGSFFLDWQRKALTVHLAGTYVGRRDDTLFTVTEDPEGGLFIFDTQRLENDDYFVLDLAVSYALTDLDRSPLKSLKIFAKGHNILDEDYEEILGFSSPGIRAMGGVEIAF